MSSSRAAVLAQWEEADAPTAPLTPAQRLTLTEIAELSANRPMPKDLPVTVPTAMKTSYSSASLATMTATGGGGDAKSSDVASFAGSDVELSGRLFPAVARLERQQQRVDTGHQFLEWLHHVENNLQFQEDAAYRTFIAQLERHKSDADSLYDEVSHGQSELETLRQQYEFVSTKSNSLHSACQHLLQEQTQLASLAEKLSQKLVFYSEADRIGQKLTSSALAVNSDVFFSVLDRIDECLIYVLEHPTYKQASVYRVKYQACLSRALALVRTYVRSAVEAATAAAMPPAGAPPIKSNTDPAFTLFYGKFRALAPKLSKVLTAIEQRLIDAKEDTGNEALRTEYESVVSDCLTVYLSSRGRLLAPAVRSVVTELSERCRRDHCGLVRAGCAFMLHVCDDEYQLCKQFFQTHTDSLDSFLEGLCQILYDTVRPLVIHLQHLETLSELTGILRSEMLGHHCAGHPPQLSAFERVASQLLQDVQERLVYRAHIYVRTDILGYSPAPGDLAYPQKLEMMEAIAESLKEQQPQQKPMHQRQGSSSSLVSATSMEVAQINGARANSQASNSPADLHGMWYPPLRRTLVCLSKLYRCLDRETFQGLSQEALSACMSSIASAGDAIAASKQLPSAALSQDALLFKVKDLLILREQIAPFHADFSVRETGLDFGRLRSAATALLTTRRGDVFSLGANNALLALLLEGAPEVKEYCRDSRKEVDRQLKATCEAFIALATGQVVGKMQEFMKKVDDHRNYDKTRNISREPWARPDILQAVVSHCLRELKRQFPIIQRAMQLYLANRETEFILFRPIRNNVLSTFISFLQLTRHDYSQDEQIIIACPSQEQIAVLITSLQLQPKTPRGSESRQRSEEKDSAANGQQAISHTERKEEESTVIVNGGKENNNASDNLVKHNDEVAIDAATV